jgi:hypothetical protein
MHIPSLSPRQRSVLVTLLDLLTAAAFVAAAAIVLRGGNRFRLGSLRVSMTDPYRIVAWGAGLVLLRWGVWRHTPPLPALRLRGLRAAADVERVEYMAGRAPAGDATPYLWGLVALILVPLWPQLQDLRAVPDPGDPYFSAWRVAWVAHQIVRSPLHLFDANIFYPLPLTLSYSDSMLLPALIASPLVWAGLDPVLAANLLLVASFPLAGVAFFLAARRLTGDLRASFVAGLMGALAPFHFEHYSHLELQFFFWMPLALVALLDLLTAPSTRAAVLLAALVGGQYFSSMYFGIMLLTYLVPFTILVSIAWRIRPSRSLLRPMAVGALVGLAALSALSVPYLQSSAARGGRPVDIVEFYSAVPSDYLQANNHSATYGRLLNSRPTPERQLFPGFTTAGFALGALVPPVAAPAMAVLGAGVLAADWSCGLRGFTYRQLFRWVRPFRDMRVPARFAVLVASSLAILSAYGVRRILRLSRSRRWQATSLALIVALVLVDLWPRIPVRNYWPSVPSVYRSVTENMVLAEFPMDFDQNVAYSYFSTTHWAKLLNGNSGYFPDRYVQLQNRMRDFPAPETLGVLRQQGATHLTVNCAFYTRSSQCHRTMELLDASNEVSLVARDTWQDSEVRLYRFSER